MDKQKFPFENSNIEEMLLVASLQSREFWVQYNDHIDKEFFNEKKYSQIFQIMKVYFDKYNSFPIYDIALNFVYKKNYGEDTSKALKRVYDKIGTISDESLEFLNDETYKFIKENKIAEVLYNSIDKLEEKKYLEIEEDIKNAILWNAKIEIGTDYSDVHNRMEKLENLKKNIIKTPWDSLNTVLDGGLYNKELTMIAASSSVGKSIMMDNIASYAWRAQQKDTLIITLELSEIRKCQRIDAEINNIEVSKVLEHKEKIFRYFEENDNSARLFIKEFPTSSVNTKHIRNYIQQLELYKGFKPSVIIVDYLDILNPNKNGNNSYENQGIVGENLRALGQEYDCPIVTASQLNRQSLEATCINELDESKLADSFKKMMIADTLILLHNTIDERAAGRINMKLIKNRNGAKDIILPFNISYPTLKIKNIYDK